MALFYVLFGLVLIQGTCLINADDTSENEISLKKEPISEADDLMKPVEPNHLSHDHHAASMDLFEMFFKPNSDIFHSPSATKMAHATNSDKSPEEQIEDIKVMANEIGKYIQSEMANLLSFIVSHSDKNKSEDNKVIEKRSAESPVDSSKLVMRLLKHIKSNNEYQNLAIEKMMTAQEIADQFGIDFKPDEDILTDLAVSTNKQAENLTDILKDACEYQNKTDEISFIPLDNVDYDESYYVYAVEPEVFSYPKPEVVTKPQSHQSAPKPQKHHHHNNAMPHHHHIQSTTPAAPLQQPPVSHKPPFYQPFMPPAQQYPPQCFMEPVTTTTTIILPLEDPEPELVGEEFEETITSKVSIDHDDPAGATVNHVMTYTVAEKAHFKKPELPQQMKYYFYL